MADAGGDGRRTAQRKKLAGYALVTVLAVGLAAVIGMQMMTDTSTPTGQVSAVDTGDRFHLGADDAPVTVVEFADFKCPHCGRFESEIYPQLKKEYIDKGVVQFYYYNFPVTGQQAQVAAIAAECVAKQDEDAFWDYKAALFERQTEPFTGIDFFTNLADESVGDTVDTQKMAACIENGDTVETVRNHIKKAQEQGARGTPTVIVGNETVDWRNYESVSAAIEDYR